MIALIGFDYGVDEKFNRAGFARLEKIVKYPIYLNMESDDFDGLKREEKFPKHCAVCPTLFSPVIAGGRTYAQYGGFIKEIRGEKLVNVCAIPDFKLRYASDLHHKLFVVGDQLYCTNNTKIFKVVDDKC